jgi:hypothetical protein
VSRFKHRLLLKRIFTKEIFNTLSGGEEAPTPRRTTTQTLKPITDHHGDGIFSRKENKVWQRKEKPSAHPRPRLQFTGEKRSTFILPPNSSPRPT